MISPELDLFHDNNLMRFYGSGSERFGCDRIMMLPKFWNLFFSLCENVQETRAMKKRLQRAKLKKDNLLAEVRFLRRRYKVLKKNSLGSTVLEVASPCQPMMGAQAVGLGCDATTRETAYVGHAVSRGVLGEPSSSLDWSRTSEDKPLAAREFQVFWEPLRATGQGEVSTFLDAAKRNSLLESGGLASELKLSIFKDIPNGFVLPTRTAKRNISWQDQMALKV